MDGWIFSRGILLSEDFMWMIDDVFRRQDQKPVGSIDPHVTFNGHYLLSSILYFTKNARMNEFKINQSAEFADVPSTSGTRYV
jgi:hypothetical protein